MAAKPFDIRGINHVALVCSDMERTVEFYRDTLGLPLVKTIELPGNAGQHFFFGLGNGDCLAFFWFPDAPPASPGVASAGLKGLGTSAHGSMNHVAFDVSAELIDVYRERLKSKGVKCSVVLNHDASPAQFSKDVSPTTFVRSIYFRDPDGVLLEFAGWTRELGQLGDVVHEPAKSSDVARYTTPRARL